MSVLVVLIAMLMGASVAGAQPSILSNLKVVEYIDAYDGDTFTVLVDGEEVRVRPLGVNCPEQDTKEGQAITEIVRIWLSQADVIVLEDDISSPWPDLDQWGRWLCHVWLYDHNRWYNLSVILLENGMAELAYQSSHTLMYMEAYNRARR